MIYVSVVCLVLICFIKLGSRKGANKETEIELPALVKDIPLKEPQHDPIYFCGCPCKVCHENGWDCFKDSL